MCLGGAPGTIETLNGFFVHEEIPMHRQKHPQMPLIWTELWTGWYDIWGAPHHTRDACEIAYGVLRFMAAGGTGINYYMWHGGTNFAREGMYLQTTSYDYDAPLDEFGRPTTKYHHLANLHQALQTHVATLLSHEDPVVTVHEPGVGIWKYGDLAFICNDRVDAPAEVALNGHLIPLPPRSGQLWHGDRLLFDSAVIAPDAVVTRSAKPVATPLEVVGQWLEPVGSHVGDRMDLPEVVRDEPTEQLAFTHDRSDYCWYVTEFTTTKDLTWPTMTIQGMADIVHVFSDDRLLGSTVNTPLIEDRPPFDADAYTQTIVLDDLKAGTHPIAMLAVSTGLIKGDWQIGHRNMVEERRGIWGAVTIEGQTLGPWHIQPGLLGEAMQIAGDSGLAVEWDDMTPPTLQQRQLGMIDHLVWHRFAFAHPGPGESLVVDLTGMSRGMLWLNGRLVGRYWLVAEGALQQGGHPAISTSAPTQQQYHLPIAWLREQNVLVIFDELGGDVTRLQLLRP